MSAWWVNGDQVSKTASTGDSLPIGNFIINETKNYLPPTQLLLGFAAVFEISEESKARHLKHRLQAPSPEAQPTPNSNDPEDAAGVVDDKDPWSRG